MPMDFVLNKKLCVFDFYKTVLKRLDRTVYTVFRELVANLKKSVLQVIWCKNV
jgi:hypothetical protein